jgi:hypothetical protein
MAGVFDINIDNLDFSKIRMNVKSTTATSNTQDSREARTKTDILQSVRRNTLISFAQLCRIFNIDALHPASLQLAILLMSKCTDRKYLCANFMSFVADKNKDIEIDESAATMIDRTESNALQSTSDWVTLFSYIYVAHLSESERTALRENQRVAIFMQAMRPIFKDNADVETIIVPMLCTILMHIPAASMLERVLLAQGPQHRDIEVMCLRGVNSYVDQCQHLSNDTTLQAISMLVRAIRVKLEFQLDIAAIIDLSVQDSGESSETMKRKFSLRRHIKEKDHGTVEHRAMLFERWQYEMKFSVNVSLAMQKFLYFLRAQIFQLDISALKSLVEPQMLAKTFAVKLERIDADVVCSVIKTLRVYQGNIESLLDFRSTCLVKTLNATVRSKLTPSVVLQLYVACWQHPSIREQCWRSVLNVSNFAITKGCEAFRAKYRYEQLSVIQTLLYCHTENRKTSDVLPDSNT